MTYNTETACYNSSVIIKDTPPYVMLTGQETIIKTSKCEKKFKACSRPKETFEAQICTQMVFQALLGTLPIGPCI